MQLEETFWTNAGPQPASSAHLTILQKKAVWLRTCCIAYGMCAAARLKELEGHDWFDCLNEAHRGIMSTTKVLAERKLKYYRISYCRVLMRLRCQSRS